MGKYQSKLPNKKGVIEYSQEENDTWKILYERQSNIIQKRACADYIKGLKILDFPSHRVPQCHEVSEVLKSITGWSVEPVPALIPLEEFYALLANRKFPAASFIRLREDLDYLQEPDIFHELYGHCPLLTNPAYADFVHWYGENALKMEKRVQNILGRLFWFTIEFGLLETEEGMRIYGGGILSSYEETIYALESDKPERKKFDLIEILNKPFRYDIIQNCYYYISDLADLFELKSEKIIAMAKQAAGDKPTAHDHLAC